MLFIIVSGVPIAARCLKMYPAFHSSQGVLNDDAAVKIATKIGLNEKAAKKALSDPTIAETWREMVKVYVRTAFKAFSSICEYD